MEKAVSCAGCLRVRVESNNTYFNVGTYVHLQYTVLKKKKVVEEVESATRTSVGTKVTDIVQQISKLK